MNDELDIMKSHNNDRLAVKNIRSNMPHKFKRKLNVKRLLIIMTVSGLSGYLTAALLRGVDIANNYEAVMHKNDVLDESNSIVHTHELTLETFVRDYKFVNESATIEDVQSAIDRGEFDFYLEYGKVKYMKSLQDEKIVGSVEFYNENTLDFYERYIIDSNSMENIEDKGMTK